MHITTAKRLLKVADRLPKKRAQRFLKEVLASYIFRVERPTYYMTQRQINAGMSSPE